jgi:hypothetical protein
MPPTLLLSRSICGVHDGIHHADYTIPYFMPRVFNPPPPRWSGSAFAEIQAARNVADAAKGALSIALSPQPTNFGHDGRRTPR